MVLKLEENKMIKKIIVLLLVFVLSFLMVLAHGEETFAEAEEIIESKIDCDQLTDDQLEAIGDYYMEQMHPGESHETMDEMMGGEGSESLRQMHINMARNFYCGEHDAMSSGMMNMMMGKGMMSSGSMMGIADNQAYDYKNKGGMINMMGSGMWPFSWFGMGFGFVFMVLFWGLIIWLIVWLINNYGKPKQTGKSESAMEILKKRFAKGEITKKQFEEMKKEVSK